MLSETQVPITNGWQTWETTNPTNIKLEAGSQTLQLLFSHPSSTAFLFNLNWWELEKTTDTGVKNENTNTFRIYPNPAKKFCTLSTNFPDENSSVKLYSLSGLLVKTIELKHKATQPLNISDLSAGVYLVQLISANNTQTTTIQIIP